MSRKLLHDQPLATDVDDLEGLNYFEKQERKVAFKPQIVEQETKTTIEKKEEIPKESRSNNPSSSRTEITITERRETKERKTGHHMQILDEDAEHFKNKLEDMVNRFKTETMTEFMNMKKSLLEEQNEAVETETRKYTRILDNRNTELDRAKEALALRIKQHERSEIILHVVSRWCGEAKIKKNNAVLLSKYFAQLRLFREHMKMKRKLVKVASTHSKRNYIRMCFNAWRTHHSAEKEQKTKVESEELLNRELSDLAAKYSKEIESLSQKLSEVNEQLEIANKGKVDMQENLKKAFMRGVCALNFEAMNILQTNESSQENINQTLADHALKEASNIFGTQSRVQIQKTYERTEFNKENYANPLIVNPIVDDTNNESFTKTNTSPIKKSVVFYQNPRLESKEARWKDAPLVGASTGAPKTDLQITKVRDFAQKTVTAEHDDSDYNAHEDHHGDEEEGKVIRVSHGKSYATSTTSVTKKTITQTSQLRSQIGKKITPTTTTPSIVKKK